MFREIFEWYSILNPTEKIEAISTVILFFTLVVIYLQLRATHKSSQAQFSVDITKELRDEKWRERLKKIYHAKYDELENDETLKFGAEYSLDKLEWVGVMLNKRIFSEDIVMKLIGGLPLRMWYQLGKFAKNKRKKRGHYAKWVEDFTKRSIEYHIKNNPMEEWTKLEREGKDTDILYELLTNEKLLSSQELWWLNFFRQIRAIRNKKLNYGYPFKQIEGLETVLNKSKTNEIKNILKQNDIELKVPESSLLCDNKWKIIDKENAAEYIVIKSGDNIYNYRGYEKWYRDLNNTETFKVDMVSISWFNEWMRVGLSYVWDICLHR